MAIVIPIDADTSGLQRKLHGATSSLGGFAKMAGLAAGAAALGGLVATLKIGTHRFMEHEKVAVRTDAVLKSTGNAAHVTAKQVDDLAKSIMAKSGIDNEQIQTGQNVLLQFRAIQNQVGANNDIFNQATQSMADMSVVMGGNTTMAAKMLGKALQDPEKAMGALKRANITFTDSQRDAIKYLDHHNRTLEAQKMVLEAVTRATGGQADALGTTLQGKLNIASTTFKNLAMDIAGVFMPKLADAATKVAGFFSELSSKGTFKAKVDFIFESAEQVASRFWTWWTQPSMQKVRSPTSGVHITFTKPGSEQVNDFIVGIDAAVKNRVAKWASDLGYNIPAWIFGGASRSGGDGGKSLLVTLAKWSNPTIVMMEFAKFGGKVARAFWDGLRQWFDDNPGVATKKIKEWLLSAGNSLGGAASSVWNSVVSTLTRDAQRGNIVPLTSAMRQRIQKAFQDAVQQARQNMQGLGSSVSSMVDEFLGRAGTGGSAIRAQLKARQDARQEAQLRDAVATAETAEDKKKAEEDLQDFLDQKEADRLDKEVEDNKAASKKKFDDLIAEFNTGQMDLTTFKTRFQGLLNEYIGPDYGSTLGGLMGTSFATTFNSTVAALLNQAGVLPAGTPGVSGPEVVNPAAVESAATKAERQKQYESALEAWKARFKKRYDAAVEARQQKGTDGDEKVTKDEWKEIDKIMDNWAQQPGNRKPQKSDYGLAMGGILTGPRYLAGEAGNEAVIPLGSSTASQMMRRAFADAVNGGGDTIINVEINAGLGTDPTELGREVVKAIKTFERKNGPVFAGA